MSGTAIVLVDVDVLARKAGLHPEPWPPAGCSVHGRGRRASAWDAAARLARITQAAPRPRAQLRRRDPRIGAAGTDRTTGGEAMDPNRLTQKTQEALATAQTLALRHGHTEIDTDHMLAALIEQADGLVPAHARADGHWPGGSRGGGRVAAGDPAEGQRAWRVLPGPPLARAQPRPGLGREGGPAPEGRVRLGRARGAGNARRRARWPPRQGGAHAGSLPRDADRGPWQPAGHERDARRRPTRPWRSTDAISWSRPAPDASTL